MSCRVALLRMERDGLLKLPPRQGQHHKPRKRVKLTPASSPRPVIRRKAGDFSLRFELVTQDRSALWNEFIDQYHYLGYTPLPGAQLRYFITSEDEILALLGFGAAAWSIQARDEYIGWDTEKRQKNLHLIVNNARFLVLPWVQSKNLCSRILSMAGKRLLPDWENRYHYRPVLLETFVDSERYFGTCYKASGWECVGETKGRGKLDVHKEYTLSRKTVWVRPLVRDYRMRLLGGTS